MFSLFDLIPALNTGLLGLALDLIIYLGLSYGIFAMAKKCGLKETWMAWVPVARLIMLGNIADLTAKKKSHLNRNALLITVALYAIAVLLEKAVFSLWSVLAAPIFAAIVGSYLFFVVTLFSEVTILIILSLLALLFSLGMLIALSGFWASVESVVSGIVLIVSVVFFAARMLAFYKAFKLFDEKRSVLYLLLCIIFDIAPAILLPVAACKSPDLPAPVAAEPVEAEETLAADVDARLAAAVAEAVEATVVADL